MSNNHYHPVKYVLVLCFFLSACTPTQQTMIPATPTTSPTIEATPVVISTPTLESQELEDLVFSSCPAITPKSPGGNQISWLLLVSRAAIYAIDPNTGERTDELIPSPEDTDLLAYDVALSPDGKWIAYVLSGENDDLVVEPSTNLLTRSSQGRLIWHPEHLFQLHGWLSNESVALRIYRSPDRSASTLIRNPFKEEEHEFFLEELPDYLYYQPGGLAGTLLFAHSNLMPDPTLKRVVYPAINADHYYLAALWDVENKKVLTSFRILWDWVYNNDPLWSLDGSDFLMMGLDEKVNTVEWFQVTRDGDINQLTHFGEILKDASIGRPSRSPDGRYLAFKLYYGPKEDGTYSDGKYLILDLKSQSWDAFCIDSGGKSNPDKPFAWSPDSKYLVITNGTIGERSAELILVDIETQKAFGIATDVEAIGWIVKP